MCGRKYGCQQGGAGPRGRLPWPPVRYWLVQLRWPVCTDPVLSGRLVRRRARRMASDLDCALRQARAMQRRCLLHSGRGLRNAFAMKLGVPSEVCAATVPSLLFPLSSLRPRRPPFPVAPRRLSTTALRLTLSSTSSTHHRRPCHQQARSAVICISDFSFNSVSLYNHLRLGLLVFTTSFLSPTNLSDII